MKRSETITLRCPEDGYVRVGKEHHMSPMFERGTLIRATSTDTGDVYGEGTVTAYDLDRGTLDVEWDDRKTQTVPIPQRDPPMRIGGVEWTRAALARRDAFLGMCFGEQPARVWSSTTASPQTITLPPEGYERWIGETYHGPASEVLFGRDPGGELEVTQEADGYHYRVVGWVEPEPGPACVITSVDRKRGVLTFSADEEAPCA